METNPRPWWQSILISCLCVGVVAAVGSLFTDTHSAWYQSLITPAIMPPSWVFPIAWTIVYAFCAASIAFMLHRRKLNTPTLIGWLVNAVLNVGWTFVFFRLHALLYSFLIILLLLASIVWLLLRSLRALRISGWLLLPYAAWVGFATALNYALVMLNPT